MAIPAGGKVKTPRVAKQVRRDMSQNKELVLLVGTCVVLAILIKVFLA